MYNKLRLAHHLLNKGGIQTKSALTMDRDRKTGFMPLPNVSYPVASVLLIPPQEGIPERILLDFSSRFALFGQIAPNLRKMAAWIIDEKTPFFEPLDPAYWDHGLILREANFELQTRSYRKTIRDLLLYRYV